MTVTPNQTEPPTWELVIGGIPIGQPRPIIVTVGRRPSLATPKTMGQRTQLGVRPHPIWRWKDAVRLAGQKLVGRTPPMAGAFQVDQEFVFPRPGTKVWKTRPMEAYDHTGKPDRDNLDKAVLDALSGIIWKDDAQVSRGWIEKRVADGDEEPRAVIRVTPLDGQLLFVS